MEVIDPGHEYELACLDEVSGWAETFSRLCFVKRIGEKFPGNKAPGHSGTTTQEVIRSLIDRTRYVDGQSHDVRNVAAIGPLREALRLFEIRAAERRGQPEAIPKIQGGPSRPSRCRRATGAATSLARLTTRQHRERWRMARR